MRRKKPRFSKTRPPIVLSANSAWNILNFRRHLVRSLLDSGHRLVALVPPSETAESLREAGMEVETVAMSPRGVSPVADLLLLARYLRLFRRLRPAAFLGFTAKPNIYGGLAAGLLRVPTISNITGLGTGFLSGRLLERLISGLYKAALWPSAAIFFHNRDDLELFVAKGLVRAERARVIPGSGIDLERFAPAPWPGPPVTFLFVGRLLIDKGVTEFAEAAAIVKQRACDARVIVVGEWAPHPRAAPLSRLEELAAAGIIELAGAVTDVRPFVERAHCVVLPSYREGLPRALLEASAMARPSIAADVPGCRDAVDHGVTGYLCAPRSAEALAEAMQQFLSLDDGERRAMGDRARQRAERLFGEELVSRAYAAALQRITG